MRWAMGRKLRAEYIESRTARPGLRGAGKCTYRIHSEYNRSVTSAAVDGGMLKGRRNGVLVCAKRFEQFIWAGSA